MAPLFNAYPEALSNTRRIAERCRFELRYGLQDLPRFPTPPGMDALAYLRRLCQDALPTRYPDPASRVLEQLAHELAVVERAGLANYFLIVWDIVRFARESGIRCQGRGSAANSLVAYLLGITPIDPLAHDLVFERFLSDACTYTRQPGRPGERGMAPDIDIDFQADRREEVIQYVYRRYGPEHTAMACTFVTFRRRSALQDVSKVLGLSPDLVRQVTAEEPRPADAHQTPAGPSLAGDCQIPADPSLAGDCQIPADPSLAGDCQIPADPSLARDCQIPAD
ncbi:MAG: hypothetical protein GTO03_03990, partial [Planctomycetales bacterium]|nr:hypothetical protein [Planctomycetales bacterium]